MNGTITLPRSVVEQALEALTHAEQDCADFQRVNTDQTGEAIEALRAALEQEPEAWDNCRGERQCRIWCGNKHCVSHPAVQPPVVEQPQSVTDCHQSQPQVEQEPVAYYVMNGAALFQLFRSKSQADALAYDLQKRHDVSGSPAHFHVVPLYTRPQPPRQPLTDEQINNHRLALPYDGEDLPDPWDFKQGVRAAERAHRIGGEA